MLSRTSRTRGVIALLCLVALLTADPALASPAPVGVKVEFHVGPQDVTLVNGSFVNAGDVDPGPSYPRPLALDVPAVADAAPVVVPLPAPLAAGLAGFAAMAALRVGRRVFRRR